jgi:tetratricopeptide (TPR) repeat protein
LHSHNDVEGLALFVDALMRSGLYQDALNVYQQHSERLLAADQGKVLENLHTIIGHVRSDPAALELLLDLFQKAGETTHVSEVIELLAHASVQTGDLRKAQELYQQLATIEPQNPIHAQNYQQVSAKLGDAPRNEMITAEEGAVIVDELEATAPSVDQDYSEEVSASVRSALTDAELFVSYNMPAKALGPLLNVLSQAPQDLRLNQRLAALHTRAGRFAEAASCCRTLESVYSGFGYAEEAGRYGDLAQRYEQRSGTGARTSAVEAESSIADLSAATFEKSEQRAFEEPEIEIVEDESLTVPAQQEAQLQNLEPAEADLSGDWETSFEAEPAAAQASEPNTAFEATVSADAPQVSDEDLVAETIEEIRFYLQQSMRLQALAAMAKLEALSKDEDLISTLRGEYEAAFAPAPVAQRAEVEPAPVEDAGESDEAVGDDRVSSVADHHAAVEDISAAAGPTHGQLEEIVADLESSLGDGFETRAANRPVQPAPPPREEIAVAFSAFNDAHVPDTLGEFVADLEGSLPDDFLTPATGAPAAIPTEIAAAVAAPSSTTVTGASVPVAAVALSPIPRNAPPSPAPAPVGPAVAAGAGGFTDLSLMFNELKSELEEDTATTAAESDPETHYNLGVAFREMGLLDEAIGELQKVCQLADKGNSFSQLMQTYTWLAQCFLDKGVPEAAIRWYERALKIPTIDEDTRTALHYELATAHENAQHRDAALGHFMEVYGSNIDYRDVAERIRALKS